MKYAVLLRKVTELDLQEFYSHHEANYTAAAGGVDPTGFATSALHQFLGEIAVRPLYARAAKDNTASIRVLQKCGFSVVGEDRFIAAPGHQVEEFIFGLSEPPSG